VAAYLDWIERLSGENLTIMLAVAVLTSGVVVGTIVCLALLVVSVA
jgi:hypothetical protein